MKPQDDQLEAEAIAAVEQCLADVPFCKTRRVGKKLRAGTSESDGVLKVVFPDSERLLVIEAKRNGQPRNARDAVNSLMRLRAEYPDAYCVFVAPFISPAAAELTEQENVGYVDFSGNCRLCFDRVYIRREGSQNKFAKRRDLRSLYSPKAERVLRALLLEPKRAWKIDKLAVAADVSLGQVSNVKKLLEDREWLRRAPDGLVLGQPEKLLAEWARNYRYGRNKVQDFYSLDPLPVIESKLSMANESGGEYALTGFSAAARLAPMVRYQRASAYVTGNIEQLAKRMGLKPVDSGATISLIAPYDDGVFTGARDIDGVRVASPVQAYLDVLNFKARGQEAADTILNEVIKRTW